MYKDIIISGGGILDKKTRLYLLLIVLVLVITGCEKGEVLANKTLITKDFNNLNLEKLNNYDIEVNLDYDNKTYSGRQITTYVNNTNKVLGEIYFHLYPNAFKTIDTAPILFGQGVENNISYEGGYIDIIRVSRDGHNLNYTIQGEGNTILHIELDEPLMKGQETKINFQYEVILPKAQERFGYGERVINGGNWYPIACVYDENGWNLDPYHKLGDPFYSDISNYNIRINTNKDVSIASSGNILSEVVEGDKKTYEIEGKLIRDFAWVASKDFKIAEKEVDGTIIKLYYLDKRDSMVKNSLKFGEDSIKTFNRLFGKYPYGIYSIVMTEFPSGMEYPGIVFIGEEYFREPLVDILEQIIVHETAHQWWYGLVGNDQIDEAWLDESLTTYSEVIYNRERYGVERGKSYFTENIKMGYEIGKSYLMRDDIVNKPLGEFTGWDDYGLLVYTKGAVFIDEIKEIYGEETLYKILNTYFEKYKFYNATTEDFIRVCEEVTKSDFSDLVKTWLY